MRRMHLRNLSSIFLFFSSYLFIAPKTIRPGNPLTIQGSLFVEPSMPVTVQAILEKSTVIEHSFGFRIMEERPSTTAQTPAEPFSSVLATFTDTQPHTFTLPVVPVNKNQNVI